MPEENHSEVKSTKLFSEQQRIDAKLASINEQLKADPSSDPVVESVTKQLVTNITHPKADSLSAIAYRAIGKSLEKRSDSAEALKAAQGMDALARANGLSYEIKVADVDKNDPNAIKAVGDQIEKDYKDAPRVMAEAQVKPIKESRARWEVKKDEVREMASGEFSRSQIRKVIYEADDAKQDHLKAIGSVARKAKGRSWARELVKLEEKREEFKEVGLGVEFSALPPEEQKSRKDAALAKMQQALKDPKRAALLQELDATQREGFAQDYAELQREAENKILNLTGKEPVVKDGKIVEERVVGAVDKSAEEAMKFARQAKEIQLKQKAQLGEVRVAVAKKASEKADRETRSSLQKLGKAFKSRNIGNVTKSTAGWLGNMANGVSARLGVVSERVGAKVTPVVDKAKDVIDRAQEFAVIAAEIDSLSRDMGFEDMAKDARDKIKTLRSGVGGAVSRITSLVGGKYEAVKTDVTKLKHQAAHKAETTFQEGLHFVAFASKSVGAEGSAVWGKVGVGIGDFIDKITGDESDEAKRESEQARADVKEKKAAALKSIDDFHQKHMADMSKPNPRLKEFDDLLLSRVKTWKSAETPSAASSTEGDAKVEGAFSRPDMRFYEVRKSKIGDVETTEAIWVDKDYTVHVDTVDGTGKQLEGTTSYEQHHTSQAEAEAFLDRINEAKKKTVEEQGGALETGLFFAFDDDGKPVLKSSDNEAKSVPAAAEVTTLSAVDLAKQKYEAELTRLKKGPDWTPQPDDADAWGREADAMKKQLTELESKGWKAFLPPGVEVPAEPEKAGKVQDKEKGPIIRDGKVVDNYYVTQISVSGQPDRFKLFRTKEVGKDVILFIEDIDEKGNPLGKPDKRTLNKDDNPKDIALRMMQRINVGERQKANKEGGGSRVLTGLTFDNDPANGNRVLSQKDRGKIDSMYLDTKAMLDTRPQGSEKRSREDKKPKEDVVEDPTLAELKKGVKEADDMALRYQSQFEDKNNPDQLTAFDDYTVALGELKDRLSQLNGLLAQRLPTEDPALESDVNFVAYKRTSKELDELAVKISEAEKQMNGDPSLYSTLVGQYESKLRQKLGHYEGLRRQKKVK